MDKNKNATINPVNKKGSKCFQYTATVALNYGEIKKDPQISSKLNKERNFPSEKDENWIKIEKNNVTIALNVLYTKKEKICPGSVPKYNSNHEKIFF